METRANYIMVGLFVLLLAFGLLGFILWLAKFQFEQEFARYDIVFESAVTGVREGSAVRYQGVRVGEVLRVDLDEERPTAIRVRIEVEKRTPVRADSKATLELEGLTGGRYVLLSGGSPDAPPLEPPPGRDFAEIPPGVSSFEEVLEGAPEVLENVNLLLRRAQALLSDTNLRNIEQLIANMSAVTGAIADNSDNIDQLIADAALTMENLREATGSLEAMAGSLESNVGELTRARRDHAGELRVHGRVHRPRSHPDQRRCPRPDRAAAGDRGQPGRGLHAVGSHDRGEPRTDPRFRQHRPLRTHHSADRGARPHRGVEPRHHGGSERPGPFHLRRPTARL